MSDLFEGQHGEPCKHDGAQDLMWVCGLCGQPTTHSNNADRVHANELADLKAQTAALVEAAKQVGFERAMHGEVTEPAWEKFFRALYAVGWSADDRYKAQTKGAGE